MVDNRAPKVHRDHAPSLKFFRADPIRHVRIRRSPHDRCRVPWPIMEIVPRRLAQQQLAGNSPLILLRGEAQIRIERFATSVNQPLRL